MNVVGLLLMFLTALTAALLYVILKYFTRFNINHLHALSFNYLTAALISFCLNFTQSVNAISSFNEILLPCLSTGLLFILVFYTAAQTTAKHGLAITSIAAKTSMVIPITAGFILYHESVTLLKLIGIALALFAVYVSNYKSEKKSKIQFMLLPVLLFIGSGFVDTSVKLAQYYFITDLNRQLFICSCFGFAGIFGLVATSYQFKTKKIKLTLRSVIAGIILGAVNYFSLDFLIRCLAVPGVESSTVFALLNMMVILLSALFAFTLFKEQPNKSNISGIVLAIIAIAVLSL